MKSIQPAIIAAVVSMGFVCLQTAEGSHFDSLPKTGNPGWNYQYETASDSTSDTHGSGGSTGDTRVTGGVMTITGPDFFDYRTTTDLDTTTLVKIRGDLEWVLRLDVNVTTRPTTPFTRIVGVGDEGANPTKDGDLFEFQCLTATGEMRVVHGGGNYDFNVSPGLHIYEFHFTSNHVIDLYVDDVLSTNGLTALVNPNVDHRLSFVRYAGNGDGTFSVERLQAANITLKLAITNVIDIAPVSMNGLEVGTCGDADIIKLQYTTNPVTGPWIETSGFAKGDGTDILLFDPAGPNGAFTYRAVRTESIIPDPALDTNQPGLNVTFDADLQPTDWGLFQNQLPTWVISNGFAVGTSDTIQPARLIYRISDYQGTNQTFMPNGGDGWVYELKFAYTGDLYFVAAAEGPGETGMGGNYEVHFFGPGGAGSGQFRIDLSGCCTIENLFPLEVNKVHTYALHYKGTNNNNELDVYVNGLRVAGFSLTNHPNFAARGAWEMNSVGFGGGNPHVSVYSIKSITIGPLQTGDYVISSSAIITDTVQLSVFSETGKIYATQSSSNLVTDTFSQVSRERLEGNGSTQNLYRVIDGVEGYFRAVEIISE